jgi:hypothetical protein
MNRTASHSVLSPVRRYGSRTVTLHTDPPGPARATPEPNRSARVDLVGGSRDGAVAEAELAGGSQGSPVTETEADRKPEVCPVAEVEPDHGPEDSPVTEAAVGGGAHGDVIAEVDMRARVGPPVGADDVALGWPDDVALGWRGALDREARSAGVGVGVL